MNQRSVSERTPSLKQSAHVNSSTNDGYSHGPYNLSANNSISRAGSRSTSRLASRSMSKAAYFQPPPGFNVLGSTPQKNTISRSTSRSSSRLSLSSMGSTSISSSRIPSSSILSTNNDTILQSKQAHIKVSIRPRPLDSNLQTSTPWNLNFLNSEIEHSDFGSFQYDHVFSIHDDNEKVFDIVAAPVISQCLSGYNGTIFAYGMTGSGKTYSMRGVVNDSVKEIFKNFNNASNILSSPLSDGMNQDVGWANENIFNEDTIIAENHNVNSRHKMKYIKCAILEIYNEKLRDLLVDDNNGSYSNMNTQQSSRAYNDLRIIDDSKFGIQVRGIKEVTVASADQLIHLINEAEKLRCVDSTDYNYRSSRSHFIIMLKLFLEDDKGTEIVSVLNFCDLAGSERAVSHTDRRKEGAYINKSLLALGTVITKLSESPGINSNVHIPYRDSKLTRLLQPSLNGGSAVSILCTIQLGSNFTGETTNTLRFGSRAKNVLLNVKKNIADFDVNKLIQENENLKLEILEMRNILQSGEVSNKLIDKDNNGIIKDDVYYELIAENNILNEQVEHLKRLQLEDGIVRSLQSNESLEKLNGLINGLILDSSTKKYAEEILHTIQYNIQEYDNRFNEIESYVGHLENRIRSSEIELARYKQQGDSTVFGTVNNMANYVIKSTDSSKDELLVELREEIEDLKQSMIRKDAMIRALQRSGNSEDL